jgi:hypothetical protein
MLLISTYPKKIARFVLISSLTASNVPAIINAINARQAAVYLRIIKIAKHAET